MKIKVCGLREPDNIRSVAALGVDFLGFIYAEKSPRSVYDDFDIDEFWMQEEDKPSLPKDVAKVGVFVNQDIIDVASTLVGADLTHIQLHGSETKRYIKELRKNLSVIDKDKVKIIKALSVETEEDVKRWREYEGVADLLLFDTKGKAAGGNGTQFDWSVLNSYDGDIPFLLSGGIDLDDAEQVLGFHHDKCIGIDLNSRFETSPGVKDVEKLRAFIEQIRGKENKNNNE